MVNAPESNRVRHVSTGRGGAANFKKATSLAKKQAEASVVINSQAGDLADCALTRIATRASLGARFATGRGGAGNILPTGQAPLPAQTEPLSALPRTNMSTGRGGAGNFKKSKTEKSTGESSSDFLSASTMTGARRQSEVVVGNKRPTFASRVPRIDADLEDSEYAAVDDDAATIKSRSNSFSSAKSAPAAMTFLGKMRRRLSSFGTALE